MFGSVVTSLGGYYRSGKYVKADLRHAVSEVSQAQPHSSVVLVPVVTSMSPAAPKVIGSPSMR